MQQRWKEKISLSSYRPAEGRYYIEKIVKPELELFCRYFLPQVREKLCRGDVLELGAESGHLSTFIKNKCAPRQVVASDLSDSLIEAMPYVNQALGFNEQPNIVILDNYSLPFKDESFDAVLGCSVLHHVPDPATVLAQVKRVLRRNGMAVFWGEPFLPGYLLSLQFLFSRYEKKQGVCESVFSLRQWFSSMQGFRIVNFRLQPPEALKSLLSGIPLVYRYCTGGGFGVVLQKAD